MTVSSGDGVSTPARRATGVSVVSGRVSINSLARAMGDLFANGEKGVWYDPSDLSTMFQDAAGTTPVTAAGQPVGLVLDKSKRLVLGENVLSISVGASWTNNGDGTYTNTGTAYGSFLTLMGFIPTTRHRVEFEVLAGTANINNGADVVTNLVPQTVVARIGPGTQALRLSGPTGARVRPISVRELPGNHATQSTATARPILRQTPILSDVELVTNGAFASDTGWTKGTGWTIGSGVASKTAGTNSDISDLALIPQIGKSYRVSYTLVVTTGQGNVRLGSTSGVTRTASGTYEETITASSTSAFAFNGASTFAGTIDNVSVREITGYRSDRNYLEFDGVDDFLVTQSIDFTATDKMTVVAGVRKMSDAAIGMVVELGNAVNQQFQLYANNAPSFVFVSKGTVSVAAVSAASFAAPSTAVLSGSGNISGDASVLRTNAVSVTNSADQGTGNYSNNPLYIGRRGGTSLPYNGRLYGLIVRGAASNDAQINSAERYMNDRTGAF